MSFFLRIFGLDTAQRPGPEKAAPATPAVAESEAINDVDARIETDALPSRAGDSAAWAPAVLTIVGQTSANARARPLASLNLDLGEGTPSPGFVGLGIDSRFSPEQGFGWTQSSGLIYRDRNTDDPLLGRFIGCLSGAPASLRVALDPGNYQVAVLMGDHDYGNHRLQTAIKGLTDELPELVAAEGEYAILLATTQPVGGYLDMTFTSSWDNWVINMIQIKAVADCGPAHPRVVRRKFSESYTDLLGEACLVGR
jgi:hypothetical protein